MFKKPEQFAKMNTQCLDIAHDFAQTSLKGLEKLTQLQLDSSKEIFEKASCVAKKVSTLENPNEVFKEINDFTAQIVESNVNNCREAYSVANSVQERLNEVIKSGWGDWWSSTVADNVESQFAKFSPATSKVMTDSVKSWIDNTNQAMNAMSKVASQVTEFTANNVKSATSATVNAVKKSTSK